MEDVEISDELYDKVFDFIKKRGPVLPAHISEFLGSNVLYASVLLDDLVRQERLKQSFAMIGDSPIYYLAGQEEKLQVLSNHLSPEEKKAYDMIKNQKVMREKAIPKELSQALAGLKDFVTALKVNVEGKEELVYKWHLLRDDEAHGLIQIGLKKGKVDSGLSSEKDVKIKEIKQDSKPAIAENDGRKRILIVDDELRILNLIKLSLIPGKYNVDTATDGEKAMEIVAVSKPSMIILDLMLPGMDGYEVCQKIKENPETRNVPIMILSAKDQVEDKIVGMKIGADDFMTKPFDPRELQARVEALLRRAK